MRSWLSKLTKPEGLFFDGYSYYVHDPLNSGKVISGEYHNYAWTEYRKNIFGIWIKENNSKLYSSNDLEQYGERV